MNEEICNSSHLVPPGGGSDWPLMRQGGTRNTNAGWAPAGAVPCPLRAASGDPTLRRTPTTRLNGLGLVRRAIPPALDAGEDHLTRGLPESTGALGLVGLEARLVVSSRRMNSSTTGTTSGGCIDGREKRGACSRIRTACRGRGTGSHRPSRRSPRTRARPPASTPQPVRRRPATRRAQKRQSSW